jgi:hypothetical protein
MISGKTPKKVFAKRVSITCRWTLFSAARKNSTCRWKARGGDNDWAGKEGMPRRRLFGSPNNSLKPLSQYTGLSGGLLTKACSSNKKLHLSHPSCDAVCQSLEHRSNLWSPIALTDQYFQSFLPDVHQVVDCPKRKRSKILSRHRNPIPGHVVAAHRAVIGRPQKSNSKYPDRRRCSW